uniref:Uncharacterized protein n=2 Tax=Vibrio TaxID=662 RepID=A0A5Q0TDT7_9VIBR
MPTLQLFQQQPSIPLWLKYTLVAVLLSGCLIIHAYSNSKITLLFAFIIASLYFTVQQLIYSQNIGFTLTRDHLQQHVYRGGWVLKWQNICHIGSGEYLRQG